MQRTITLSLFALSALLTFAAAKPYAPYAPDISPRSSDAQHLTHEKRVTHSGEVSPKCTLSHIVSVGLNGKWLIGHLLHARVRRVRREGECERCGGRHLLVDVWLGR